MQTVITTLFQLYFILKKPPKRLLLDFNQVGYVNYGRNAAEIFAKPFFFSEGQGHRSSLYDALRSLSLRDWRDTVNRCR